MQANENSVLTGDQQEETTAFLLLETAERIAQNWKQIIGIGILNIMTGMGCLLFPAFATQAVELFLICIVFATGLPTPCHGQHILWYSSFFTKHPIHMQIC